MIRFVLDKIIKYAKLVNFETELKLSWSNKQKMFLLFKLKFNENVECWMLNDLIDLIDIRITFSVQIKEWLNLLLKT